MKKILVVEDEKNMLKGLQDNLEFDGYEVDIADNGQSGLEKIKSNTYDLVLLDVMLPQISGFDICKTIRKEGIQTPIILLTARGEEIDKVRGLELGADDYITKPFSLRELMARIKAVLRRTDHANSNAPSDECTVGRLQVNFRTYQAQIEGKEVKMSAKEVDILKYLCSHRNQALDRFDIMNAIWGVNNEITTRTVDNFILKLRQKIETDPNNPKLILTIHGIGYKLV
jgi:DNA-binding response OmpR family regulator